MSRAPHPDTVACHGCDLLQRIPPLPPGRRAHCPRCREVLATQPVDPFDRPLALTLAAAVAFIVANAIPLMSLSVVGRQASTTVIGGAYEMWVQGYPLTAATVAFCVVVAPATYIAFMLTVLLAVRRPPAPHWVAEMLRWAGVMQPWSMNEVMLLGVLVSLIKIAELATVTPDVGMFALGGLIALLPAISVSVDPEEIWKRVEWADGSYHPEIA